MWLDQSVYGLYSTIRTTKPHQKCPGPPHMDGVDQGLRFPGTLFPTMFRPGVQVLIDRTECRGELRSLRFRSEHARSPSEAILSIGPSGRPPQETAERHSTAATANKPKEKNN